MKGLKVKVLVLGSSGMAGHLITAYFHENGHEALGLSRKPLPYFPTITGDVFDTGKLLRTIREGQFDAVVNGIGILNQFAEKDKDQAVFLNSYLPHYIAAITADMDTQVVHMSTDCVFSGSRGGYREDDLRDGTTFYDRSKALGELEDTKNITLRNSIVGPDLKPDGIGLFNWFMAQSGEIKGFTQAMWTGVTTLELAKAMEAAIREKIHGLFHMVYQEPICKYDLLLLFQKHLEKTDVAIRPWDGFSSDKSLIRTRNEFGYTVPDYETMVAEMADWIRTHRSWYPHYRLGE